MNKQKLFPEFGTDYNFSELETQVLKFWRSAKVFENSVSQRPAAKTYFFYDGPPFATGLPHYGHLLAGTIKDIVPRYWTQRGYRVPRRFGWDTHGLPIEFEMEKKLNLNGSLDILAYGVDKFNEACRGIVLRYTEQWREVVERLGRWIDMDNDYKTMDPDFMESVWWVFKRLYEQGLIYEGKKVVPYSWRLTAPLSNFEASLNYKDVQDPAITVLFPIRGNSTFSNTALAVWTTTPWTLPSNLAIAIHPNPDAVTYSKFKLPNPFGKIENVILAKNLAEKYGLSEGVEVKNSELVGLFYEPLFSCFDDADRKADKAFRVISADFVSATDGTGLVHMAPSFGEDDFFACKAAHIRPVDPTNLQGAFTKEVATDSRLSGIVGLFVKDADKVIIKAIKEASRLLKHDTLQHAYPFCERSDTPLIYKAISSWFVKVEDIKDKMQANNKKIHWVPDHIKEGRFGKWLENARDWCISRNRFWGTPIPVWKCKDCRHVVVIGSRKELNEFLGVDLNDLHMHFLDSHSPSCEKCGAKNSMKRTPEVLDCWFESGSMPYAQTHYPFENATQFETSFPADFIAEGLDQTRGWFYTLTVLSTALFDKPAFKNCIVNGLVLAEDGKKMSKRLRNYPDPQEIFKKYGADPLRLYLMQSPAMYGEDLKFSEKNLVELMRAVMIPLWNAYGFFASYANIDGFKVPQVTGDFWPESYPESETDQWILSRLQEVELKYHEFMSGYHLSSVAPLLIEFIDDLTNTYIRLNRSRFWASSHEPGNEKDKESAYQTLWTVLTRMSVLLGPCLPYLSEILFNALQGRSLDSLAEANCSVHLTVFGANRGLNEAQSRLIQRFDLAKRVIFLGRSLRAEAKIGVRQPLTRMRVAGVSQDQFENLKSLKPIILSELNIKNLELEKKATDLVEESIKPNHRVLGKKVGSAMKRIQDALASFGPEQISQFESLGEFEVEGHKLILEDVQIVRKARPGRFALSLKGLVAELDTTLTPELITEGLQRECVNRIQQLRKEKKFQLSDRIRIFWHATPKSLVEKIFASESGENSFVGKETLAKEFVKSDSGLLSDAFRENFEEHGEFFLKIEKI